MPTINDQLTQIKNDVNRINYQRGQQNLGKTELDKNAFFQLFMAQLQGQDPMNPVDNSQFFTQQVQMASFEKLDNLVKSLESNSLMSQAASLVGKNVDLKLPSGQMVSGKIDSISFLNNEAKINVNDQSFEMKQIIKIYDT